MKKRKLKVVGLFVFVLVFAFTMAACDMVGNNAVEDTARNVADSSETGELEVVMSGINMEEEVGAQSLLFNRFEDFQLEFYIEYQIDGTSYTETIDLDDEDILEDNLGDNGYSVTFTALRESNYDVKVTLTGYNTGSEQRVTIAEGTTEAMVIAGQKRDVSLEIQQANGGLDITVDQFPSEATGGERIDDVNIKVLDLDGEPIPGAEKDFNYDVEDQNLLVEGLFPAYYTIVISWEGHGSVREEIQARVVPGKVTDVPITLYGSQLTVGVDWMAEPASPTNVQIVQNNDGFLISWDGVENADRYNVLRKRTPYYHSHFAKIGEVEHTAEGERHELQYIVEKDELYDIADYEFQVVSVREHPEKDYDLTSEPTNGEFTPDNGDPLDPDNGFEVGDFVEETAFGGDTWGGGSRWWYYFDTAGPSVQNIYAGRNINIGTVEISEPVDGEVTITLNLKDNWDLQQDEEEAVKIKGYATADLPEKLTGVGIGNVFDTYQGTDLTITVPAYDIFIIHLDVEGTIESEDLPA
ncbi:carboxypeptidase regulatory-like domain-containing protein [Halanaerobiaceae bacterium Z-7014]|uniref:Carboxypeptidase regulatory-like domain-containing protein n=1 Tax=Halonatronomonas betaini TaxID=2778430 RepID=A0A931FBE1_9FIRM|nr:hypothetical protein [Halonatronomonas betaini]MBF8437877.1 carboxypeptidase regulatory-like domain-containing protein [Halonatronomonas betaini]